jgi:hypothetical protein
VRLLRRRNVWLPTLWGWLFLALAAGAAALLAVLQVYAFLAPRAPVGARLLVVEGWLPAAELDQALGEFRDGGYARLVTTGGPIENGFERDDTGSYAERARDYLVRHGVAGNAVVAVPAPASAQDRTYLNAVMVREWAAQSGVALDALDVFSSGAHSRRSWLLHAAALGPRVRVGILPATPSTYDPAHWWRSSAGAKEILGESIAWLWTELFFHPGTPGSHAEKWDAG